MQPRAALDDLEAEALMLYSPEWGHPKGPGFRQWHELLRRRGMLEKREDGQGRITRYGMECLIFWFDRYGRRE